jgi:hypothetical protein
LPGCTNQAEEQVAIHRVQATTKKKRKEHTMAENNVNEVVLNLSKSFREASQAITDSAVAAQERNIRFVKNTFEQGFEVLKSSAEDGSTLLQELTEQQQQGTFQAVTNKVVAAQERNARFAQSVFANSLEVLKSQAESNAALTQELVGQSQHQLTQFQTLIQESVDAYVKFLYSPLSYFKQTAEYAKEYAEKYTGAKAQ